ncbi:MAG: hypothetical protein AAF754_16935, partial [Pseudomonadota bacterium]
MSTPPDDTFGEGPTNQDGSDDKEKVAEAFRNAGVVSEEDQTRSTLHYGNDEDGTLSKTDQQAGWGPESDAPNQDDQTHGSDKVEVARAPQAGQSSDADGSKGAKVSQADISSGRVSSGDAPLEKTGQLAGTSEQIVSHDMDATPSAEMNANASPFATQVAPATPTTDSQEEILNRGPEALEMTGGTVAENASGAVVGTLSVIDPDAGDSHSFEVSDDRFEVV